jgi:hypothetical protein
MTVKTKKQKAVLTPEQIDLGAKYLAMGNICTLEHYSHSIKDLPTLKRAVHQAWEDAVTGVMEGAEGGYDDRNEGAAIDSVQEEIDSFKKDLRKGGKKASYWVTQLRKEIPYLFETK